VGPVDRTGPRSHRCPGSPLPPTAHRLLPPPPPTVRAPLIRRFWATHLSSELVVVVKIRLWRDQHFGPCDSRPNFWPPTLRVPIVLGCRPVTSADIKNLRVPIVLGCQPVMSADIKNKNLFLASADLIMSPYFLYRLQLSAHTKNE
jgi:hypothetical protein